MIFGNVCIIMLSFEILRRFARIFSKGSCFARTFVVRYQKIEMCAFPHKFGGNFNVYKTA